MTVTEETTNSVAPEDYRGRGLRERALQLAIASSPGAAASALVNNAKTFEAYLRGAVSE